MAAPILALHGLGGGAYELAPLLAALRAASYTVDCPALPGHADFGRVMPPSTWAEWFDCAAGALDRAGVPSTLLGFSTGATLALELAIERPAQVERLILICPFLAIRHRWFYGLRPEAYLTARPTRWLRQVPRRKPALRDRSARRAIALEAGPASRFRTFSLVAARSSLELIARVRRRADRVSQPTLILQSRHDSVVDPGGAPWLHERIGSVEKSLIWLEASDHLACWDHDRERVVGETLGFLGAAG